MNNAPWASRDPAGLRVAPTSMRPLGVPAEWTGAGSLRPYPGARLDELVGRQAGRTPDAIAVYAESGTVTYASLVAQARCLARALQGRGIGRDNIVAVCTDRSVHQIVGALGILLAGAAYLPIDPEGPADRRRFMLEDS